MSSVTPFPARFDRKEVATFERWELQRILDFYGRMVAAGHWRDYAMAFAPDLASFAAFRRASERPDVRLEKRPSLARKQGAWILVGEHGAVLRRGHELGPVLAPLERRLLRLVAD